MSRKLGYSQKRQQSPVIYQSNLSFSEKQSSPIHSDTRRNTEQHQQESRDQQHFKKVLEEVQTENMQLKRENTLLSNKLEYYSEKLLRYEVQILEYKQISEEKSKLYQKNEELLQIIQEFKSLSEGLKRQLQQKSQLILMMSQRSSGDLKSFKRKVKEISSQVYPLGNYEPQGEEKSMLLMEKYQKLNQHCLKMKIHSQDNRDSVRMVGVSNQIYDLKRELKLKEITIASLNNNQFRLNQMIKVTQENLQRKIEENNLLLKELSDLKQTEKQQQFNETKSNQHLSHIQIFKQQLQEKNSCINSLYNLVRKLELQIQQLLEQRENWKNIQQKLFSNQLAINSLQEFFSFEEPQQNFSVTQLRIELQTLFKTFHQNLQIIKTTKRKLMSAQQKLQLIQDPLSPSSYQQLLSLLQQKDLQIETFQTQLIKRDELIKKLWNKTQTPKKGRKSPEIYPKSPQSSEDTIKSYY